MDFQIGIQKVALRSYQYTMSTTAILVEGEGGVMMTPQDKINYDLDQPCIDVMRLGTTPVKTNQLYSSHEE